jgi:hypothetical protein
LQLQRALDVALLQMRIRRLIPLCASGIAPSPPAFLESAAFSIFSILIFDFFEGHCWHS